MKQKKRKLKKNVNGQLIWPAKISCDNFQGNLKDLHSALKLTPLQ